MTKKGQEITLSCRVDPYRAGWTLLTFLTHRFRYHPQERWRVRLDEQRVKVNGGAGTAATIVCENDVITYTIHHDEPEVDRRFDVLYKDDDLIAIAKSGNLPVHASGIFIRNTLIALMKEKFGDNVNLAHRLDRETSGVVVLTRNRDAARAISAAFFNNKVEKRYVVAVHGVVAADGFDVDAPIGKAPDLVALSPARHLMTGVASDLKEDLPRFVPYRCVDFETGKAAVTHFRVMERGQAHTILDARPVSGRTNQIRVHLQHAGFPIIGDKIYGDGERDAAYTMKRQMLHCRLLRFNHPTSAEPVTIEAPLPPDIRGMLAV